MRGEVPAVRDLLTELFFPPRWDSDAGEMVTPEETFAGDVRPWLGNSVAVFLPSFDPMMSGGVDMPIVVAAQITDQAGADEFLSIAMPDIMELYERVEQDGTIVYRASSSDAAFVVTDNVLLAGMVNSVVLPGADAVNLLETGQFRNTLAGLPEDAYNIVVYTDFTGLVDISGDGACRR